MKHTHPTTSSTPPFPGSYRFYLRLIYGGIFVISGTMKLFDITSFQLIIAKLYLVPPLAIPSMSIALPIIETGLGICIMANIRMADAIKASIFLLTLFSGILLGKLSEGTAFSCGCFGDFSKGTVDYSTIERNVVFILIGLIVMSLYKESPFVGHLQSGSRTFSAQMKRLFLDSWNALVSLGFGLIIVFLISQTIILAAQNKILKERIQIMTGTDNTLEIGASVPQFTAMTNDGKFETIASRTDPATLLFIMKTSCDPCKKNIPIWSHLTGNIHNNTLLIRGIMLDSFDNASAYVHDNKIAFPVLNTPPASFRSDYKVSVTPLTLLISNGVVKGRWKGTLDTQQQQEIIDATRQL